MRVIAHHISIYFLFFFSIMNCENIFSQTNSFDTIYDLSIHDTCNWNYTEAEKRMDWMHLIQNNIQILELTNFLLNKPNGRELIIYQKKEILSNIGELLHISQSNFLNLCYKDYLQYCYCFQNLIRSNELDLLMIMSPQETEEWEITFFNKYVPQYPSCEFPRFPNYQIDTTLIKTSKPPQTLPLKKYLLPSLPVKPVSTQIYPSGKHTD